MTKKGTKIGAWRRALFTLLVLLSGAAGAAAASELQAERIGTVVELFNEIVGPDAAACWSGVAQPIASGVPALDVPLGPKQDCDYVIDLYSFEAESDETLLIELFGPPHALLVGLLDQELHVIDGAPTSERGEAAIAMILSETGTYTIAVMGEAMLGETHRYSLYMDAGYDLFRPCFEEKEALLAAGMSVEFALTVDPAALPDFCRGFESYLVMYGEADQDLVILIEGENHEIDWMWIDTLDRRPVPNLVVDRIEEAGDRVALGRATLPDTDYYVLGIGWRINVDEGVDGGRYWVELYSPVDKPNSAYAPVASMDGLITLADYAEAPTDLQQHYLAGIWDGVFALLEEIAHVELSESPPALPSHAAPISEEEWRGMGAVNRSDLAHDLAMWKLMRVLGEDGFLSEASSEELALQVVDGLKSQPPNSAEESMALIAWSLLAEGDSEPAGPQATDAGGFWRVAPFSEVEPDLVNAYLLGVLDGWLAVATEMQAIRDSDEPPLLPAGNDPISSEEWAASESDARASLATRLAIWRFSAALSERGEVHITQLQQALLDRVGPPWAWDDTLPEKSAAMLFWEGMVLSHPLERQ